MTPREREIMELIRDNPKISQMEIADRLNITRSSVAAHINNLSKQGYILGRAYIINDKDYALVIGGANVDIIGYGTKKLIKNESNNGHILESTGGVGRNIADNMSRLGINTSFITALGSDNRADFILEDLKKLKINVDGVYIIDGERTSVYLALLDENRDMLYAINDMDVILKLTPNLLQKKIGIVQNASLCVLDTNLSKQTIDFLLNEDGVNYFVDSVSVNKSEKIKDVLDRIYFLKANKYEAEFLGDTKITDLESARICGRNLINKGLKSLVITLGEEGSIYFDKNGEFFIYSEKISVKNASGAGDAFMAGYIYGYLQDMNIEDRMKFATCASRVALMSEKTISDKFNVNEILKEMNYVK